MSGHAAPTVRTITHAETSALIARGRAVVKNIYANPTPDFLSDVPDKDLQFILRQLADPQHVRPVKAISEETSFYFNPLTREKFRKPRSTPRGAPKPWKTHTKKTSVSLLPKCGKMNFYHRFPHGCSESDKVFYLERHVGLIFDLDLCDKKGEKYTFPYNAATNRLFWRQHSDAILGQRFDSMGFRGMELAFGSWDFRRGNIDWNEALVGLSLDSLRGIFFDFPTGYPLWNAIRVKQIIKKELGIDLPLFCSNEGFFAFDHHRIALKLSSGLSERVLNRNVIAQIDLEDFADVLPSFSLDLRQCYLEELYRKDQWEVLKSLGLSSSSWGLFRDLFKDPAAAKKIALYAVSKNEYEFIFIALGDLYSEKILGEIVFTSVLNQPFSFVNNEFLLQILSWGSCQDEPITRISSFIETARQLGKEQVVAELSRLYFQKVAEEQAILGRTWSKLRFFINSQLERAELRGHSKYESYLFLAGRMDASASLMTRPTLERFIIDAAIISHHHRRAIRDKFALGFLSSSESWKAYKALKFESVFKKTHVKTFDKKGRDNLGYARYLTNHAAPSSPPDFQP